MQHTFNPDDEPPAERLVSLSEARRRLGRGLPALRRMVAEGALRGVVCPHTGALRVVIEDTAPPAAMAAAPAPQGAPLVLADGDVARCVRWRRELAAACVPGPVLSVYDTPSLLLLLERMRPRLLVLGRMSHFDDPVRLVAWLRSTPDLPQPPVVFAREDLTSVIERIRLIPSA